MANCVSVMTKILRLYKFAIPLQASMENVTHKSQAVSD